MPKSKMGRPPIRASQRKTELAVTMLTEAQYRRLHTAAHEKDITISQLIRLTLRPILQPDSPGS